MYYVCISVPACIALCAACVVIDDDDGESFSVPEPVVFYALDDGASLRHGVDQLA